MKFEAELARLETHLKAKKVTWAKANDELLQMLDAYDLDFEAVGKKMGTKYAAGYVTGVNKALGSIAAAVAKLLGLDAATVRNLSAPTAASAVPVAPTAAPAPGQPPAPPSSPITPPTAPSAAVPVVLVGGGNQNPLPVTVVEGIARAIPFTVVINAGVFTGTQADARRWAREMWIFFLEESERRQRMWPPKSDWKKIAQHVGI